MELLINFVEQMKLIFLFYNNYQNDVVLVMDKLVSITNLFLLIIFIYILGETLLDVNHLRELCHQIQSSENIPVVIFTPVKPAHYIKLEFPSTLNRLQRVYK